MELKGLPTVMVGSGTDTDECWFRELVAWVVMEPREGLCFKYFEKINF